MKPKYYISHELAFEVWRAARLKGTAIAKQTHACYSPSFPNSASRDYLGNWLNSLGVHAPYSFMVAQQTQRHETTCGFNSRLVSSPPMQNSFFRIVDKTIACAPFDLFIVSPELNFVQMANTLSTIETIAYGYELCGTYTRLECNKDKPRQLLRLSTPNRLITYSNRAFGMHGAKKARCASEHVLANSASVKETEVAMMLTLPKRMEGFALPKPKLNYGIKVDNVGKSFVSQNLFIVDEFWNDFNVGLEVDTNKYHSDPDKRIKDARRRNTLKHYGYSIVEGTHGDTSTALGMAGLGMQLYKLMKIRPRPGQFDVTPGRIQLYREISQLSNYP